MKKIVTSLLVTLGMVSSFADEVAVLSPERMPVSNATQAEPAQQQQPMQKTEPAPMMEKKTFPKIRPGEPIDPNQIPAGYGQFAGVQFPNHAVDLFVMGDFLYWKPTRRARVDILKFNNDFPANTIRLMDEDTGYRPAFKVGIGLGIPKFDRWILMANYTWFHHEFTNHYSAKGAQSLEPVAIPLIFLPFTEIKSRVKFDYDEGKIFVQRPMYIGKRLILTPYFGLRGFSQGLKISQELKIEPGFFIGSVGSNFESLTYRSWAIGPSGGGSGNLLLGAGFSILAKGEVGVLYVRNIKNAQEIVNNSVEPLGSTVAKQKYLKNPYWISPTAEAGLGLAWGGYFNREKCHVDFAATYDFLSVWNPLQDGTIVFIVDTVYRGFTFHGRLDF